MVSNNSAVNIISSSSPAVDDVDPRLLPGTGTQDGSIAEVYSPQPETHQPDKHTIPYSRFKEVIDERNRLREELASNQNKDSRNNPQLSDEELNYLWDENPSHAAKLMFSELMRDMRSREAARDEHLSKTLERYPELRDTNHAILHLAKEIISVEMPELKSDPRGLAIAAEIAAGRYYRDQFTGNTRESDSALRTLEATRTANLRYVPGTAGLQTGSVRKHDALSADEQRIARMMGVPVDQYVNNKRNKKGGTY
ncbi:MAG: hypothetical protein C4541_09140 [Candidatus Auribacter fodinae]|uniref:Uncharacterized protein n=1 Tax=Candidatus Auribacter fodinae TaxID=2093366 RepID=A0A3A4QVV1_9BACT|nr:MAG: hypothetical protein C4541_09140 [Candidatus Auribacter fodinae]